MPTFPIKTGDNTTDVALLQGCLRYLGYSLLFDGGIFGTPTAHAVTRFQLDHGFRGTGRVDRKTWNAVMDDLQLSLGGVTNNWTSAILGKATTKKSKAPASKAPVSAQRMSQYSTNLNSNSSNNYSMQNGVTSFKSSSSGSFDLGPSTSQRDALDALGRLARGAELEVRLADVIDLIAAAQPASTKNTILVRGVVISADGYPLPKSVVTVETESFGARGKLATARTDANGAYVAEVQLATQVDVNAVNHATYRLTSNTANGGTTTIPLDFRVSAQYEELQTSSSDAAYGVDDDIVVNVCLSQVRLAPTEFDQVDATITNQLFPRVFRTQYDFAQTLDSAILDAWSDTTIQTNLLSTNSTSQSSGVQSMVNAIVGAFPSDATLVAPLTLPSTDILGKLVRSCLAIRLNATDDSVGPSVSTAIGDLFFGQLLSAGWSDDFQSIAGRLAAISDVNVETIARWLKARSLSVAFSTYARLQVMIGTSAVFTSTYYQGFASSISEAFYALVWAARPQAQVAPLFSGVEAVCVQAESDASARRVISTLTWTLTAQQAFHRAWFSCSASSDFTQFSGGNAGRYSAAVHALVTISSGTLTAESAATFYAAWLNRNRSSDGSFWTGASSYFTGSPPLARIQCALAMWEITNEAAVFGASLASACNPSPSARHILNDWLALTVAEWSSALSTNSTTGIPSPIAIMTQLEAALPVPMFVARFERAYSNRSARTSADTALASFFSTPPVGVSVIGLDPRNPPAISSSYNGRDQILRALAEIARVGAVSPNYVVIQVARSASATTTRALSRLDVHTFRNLITSSNEFLTLFGAYTPNSGSRTALQQAVDELIDQWVRACVRGTRAHAARVVQLRNAFSDRFAFAWESGRDGNGQPIPAGNQLANATQASLGTADQSNLQTALGTFSSCDCCECKSVLSPLAYLADLLTELSMQEPDVFSRLCDDQNGKRPNITKLLASCENLETLVPYIDLANELLEAMVAGSTSGLPVETVGTGEERAAYPQVLTSSAYSTLASAAFPASLPFALGDAEAGAYLPVLGTSLRGVREAGLARFSNSQDDINRVVATRLGLSVEAYVSIFTFMSNPGHKFFGYATGSTLPGSVSVREFLFRAGIAPTELDSVVNAQFPLIHQTESTTVNQATYPVWGVLSTDARFAVSGLADCNIDAATIAIPGTTNADKDKALARLGALVRIARTMEWSIADTDAICELLTRFAPNPARPADSSYVSPSSPFVPAPDLNWGAFFADVCSIAARLELTPLAVARWAIARFDSASFLNSAASPVTPPPDESWFSRFFLANIPLHQRATLYPTQSSTDTTVTTAGMAQAGTLPVVAAALGVDEATLLSYGALVTDNTTLRTTPWTLDLLAQVERAVSLGLALGLAPDDLKTLSRLAKVSLQFDSVSPFWTSSNLVDLVDLRDALRHKSIPIAVLSEFTNENETDTEADANLAALVVDVAAKTLSRLAVRRFGPQGAVAGAVADPDALVDAATSRVSGLDGQKLGRILRKRFVRFTYEFPANAKLYGDSKDCLGNYEGFDYTPAGPGGTPNAVLGFSGYLDVAQAKAPVPAFIQAAENVDHSTALTKAAETFAAIDGIGAAITAFINGSGSAETLSVLGQAIDAGLLGDVDDADAVFSLPTEMTSGTPKSRMASKLAFSEPSVVRAMLLLGDRTFGNRVAAALSDVLAIPSSYSAANVLDFLTYSIRTGRPGAAADSRSGLFTVLVTLTSSSAATLDTAILENAKRVVHRLQQLVRLGTRLSLAPDDISRLTTDSTTGATFNVNDCVWLPNMDDASVATANAASGTYAGARAASLLGWQIAARYAAVASQLVDSSILVADLVKTGSTISLADAFGWRAEEAAFFGSSSFPGHTMVSARDLQALDSCNRLVALLRKTGVSAQRLWDWQLAGTSATNAAAVQSLIAAARAKIGNDQWGAVGGKIRGRLRERQRDALTAYLLGQAVASGSSPVPTADDLYAALLIDVQMCSCRSTTRVVEAINAIQLYVDRIRLGLESGAGTSLLKLTDAFVKNRWPRIGSYRIWEADRKLLLYTENWLEPELRAGKSPQFERFETEIAQSDWSDDAIEAAFEGYLSGLSEVSHLEVAAVLQRPGTDGVIPETIHFIGKAKGNPTQYFHREFRSGAKWTAWKRIGLSLDEQTILPLEIGHVLHLFWAEIVKNRPDVSDTDTLGGSAAAPDGPDASPPVRYDVRLVWSAFRHGSWTTPRKSAWSNLGVQLDGTVEMPKPNGATEFRAWETIREQLALTAITNISGTSAGFLLKDYWWSSPDDASNGFAAWDFDGISATPVAVNMHGDVAAAVMKASPISQSHVPQGAVWTPPGFGPLSCSYDAIALFGGDGTPSFTISTTPSDYHLENVVAPMSVVTDPSNQGLTSTRLLGVVAPAIQPWAVFASPTSSELVGNIIAEPLWIPYAANAQKIQATRGARAAVIEAQQQQSESNGSPGIFTTSGKSMIWAKSLSARFDGAAASSLYSWELFFHAPLYVATQLTRQGRYEAALAWFQTIYDRTCLDNGTVPQTYWRSVPVNAYAGLEKTIGWFIAALQLPALQNDTNLAQIKADNAGTLYEAEAMVSAWLANPFDPHAIASVHVSAYARSVVMKFLDLLIAWGDSLFAQATMETVNQATQLYVLAGQVLGPRPIEPSSGCAGENNAAPSFASLASAATSDGLSEYVDTYIDLKSNLPAGVAGVSSSDDAASGLAAYESRGYFCVPPNTRLLGYWDSVADRLFKVRHCLGLDGKPIDLPFFGPPIDPGLLARATALGLTLNDIFSDLDAVRLESHRFPVLLQRANEMCGDVKSLGSAMLTAMEKRDAEAIALLRSGHEIGVLDRIEAAKVGQRDEAQTAVDAMQNAIATVDARWAYYRTRTRTNLNERLHIAGVVSAGNNQQNAQELEYEASLLNILPQTSVGWSGGPSFTASFGFQQLAGVPQSQARQLNMVASLLNLQATIASVQGSFDRRSDDWAFQADQARLERSHLMQQLVAAEIRLAVTNVELENHRKQMANAREVDEIMRSKFTNKELFDWMSAELGKVHRAAHDAALRLARRAQAAYIFETRDTTAAVIQQHWDSLRKGLLAGEGLQQDLRTLEVNYIDQRPKEHELTKHLSLALLMPDELKSLRETGICHVDLTEPLFDLDFPGHYMRRFRSLAVTMPSVAGPYAGVRVKISVVGMTKLRVSNALDGTVYKEKTGGQTLDPRFQEYGVPVESFVTSGGSHDGGVFDDRDDLRYLPLEGGGVIAKLRIELPGGVRAPEGTNATALTSDDDRCIGFDRKTISDLVLHIRYSARDGGDELRGAAFGELKAAWATAERFIVLSAKTDFASEWETFRDAQGNATSASFVVGGQRMRFPYPDRDGVITVDQVERFLILRPDAKSAELPTITNATLPTNSVSASPWSPKVGADVPVNWSTEFTAPNGRFLGDALDLVDDVWFIVRYTVGGTVPERTSRTTKSKLSTGLASTWATLKADNTDNTVQVSTADFDLDMHETVSSNVTEVLDLVSHSQQFTIDSGMQGKLSVDVIVTQVDTKARFSVTFTKASDQTWTAVFAAVSDAEFVAHYLRTIV